MTMDAEDLTKLVTWVKKIHSQGRHAVMLVDGYDAPELSNQLRAFFPDHTDGGRVDFMVPVDTATFWVCLRPILQRVPTRLLKDPTVGVCTITK